MLRKKLLKTFSVLSLAALSPIAFLSACGQSSSVVTTDIDESFFYVANPYVPNKLSWHAINDIVESYNKYIEEKNKSIKEGEKKWIPAKIQYLGDNYYDTKNKVINLLEINANEERPSSTVNYADLLSHHAKHGKESAFEDPKLLSVIAPAFRKVDAQVEGLDEGKNWVVPFGFSGVVTGINTPMLAHVVKTFLKAGARLSEDAEEQQWFAKVRQLGVFDAAKVEQTFGPLTTDPAVLQRIRNYQFDRKNWHTAVGYFEFGSLIIDAFPKYQHYVIGIDAPADHFSTMLFTLFNNKHEEMPFKLVKENGRFAPKVNKLFDPSSTQYKNARKVFNLMKAMMQKRVLWIKTTKRGYASTYFQQHQIMFSTGSSAGWEFSYTLATKLAAKRDGKEHLAKQFLFPSLKGRASTLSNLKIKNVDLNKDEVFAHGQFGYVYDGTPEVKRLFMGEGTDGLTPPKAAGPSDLVFTPAVTRKIKELFALDDGSQKDNFVVLDQQNHPLFKGAEGVESNFVYKNGSGKTFANEAFALSTEVVPQGFPESLQPWELKATFAPLRFDTNTTHKAVYVNGPVMMKFGVSPERDRNAENFVKFFLTQKVWDRYRKGELQGRVNMTPAQHFVYEGNYVPVDSKSLYEVGVPEAKADNEYFKYTYEGFKEAADGSNPKFGLYRAIVASSNFYEALSNALANAFKNPNYTFEDFLNDVRQVLLTDGLL